MAVGFDAVTELDEGLLEDPVFVFDAFAWEDHDAERAGVWSGGVGGGSGSGSGFSGACGSDPAFGFELAEGGADGDWGGVAIAGEGHDAGDGACEIAAEDAVPEVGGDLIAGGHAVQRRNHLLIWSVFCRSPQGE